MSGDDFYTDTPTIASEPIYVGPPDTLKLEDDVGEVRVWGDQLGEWIDDEWEMDGDELRFVAHDDPGTVRVVEMVPVGDHESGSDFREVGADTNE